MAENLFLLAGQSGVGKDTIRRNIVKYRGSQINLLLRTTTRHPRPDEIEGIDYHFETKSEFLKLSELAQMIYPYEFNENWYGLDRRRLKEALDHKIIFGVIGLCSIGVKSEFPRSKLIYVHTEENDVCNRLRKRGYSDNIIERMILLSRQERLTIAGFIDYYVENPDGLLAKTVNQICQIMNIEQIPESKIVNCP